MSVQRHHAMCPQGVRKGITLPEPADHDCYVTDRNSLRSTRRSLSVQRNFRERRSERSKAITANRFLLFQVGWRTSFFDIESPTSFLSSPHPHIERVLPDHSESPKADVTCWTFERTGSSDEYCRGSNHVRIADAGVGPVKTPSDKNKLNQCNTSACTLLACDPGCRPGRLASDCNVLRQQARFAHLRIELAVLYALFLPSKLTVASLKDRFLVTRGVVRGSED